MKKDTVLRQDEIANVLKLIFMAKKTKTEIERLKKIFEEALEKKILA